MSETSATVVRKLIREARFAALATLEGDGAPYASLVAVATDPEGRPTLLISTLARHTRNIAADARVSLLVTAAGVVDPMDAPRASLIGRIVRTEEPLARTRYLARHEGAAMYADFKDFAFFRVELESAHLVQGFGRIVDVPGARLLTDWSDAAELKAGHDGVIAHMNADHADAVGLYATRLLGAAPGAWRMVGIDPEGCEIATPEEVRRLDFAAPAGTMGAVRKTLVDLVTQARQTDAA